MISMFKKVNKSLDMKQEDQMNIIVTIDSLNKIFANKVMDRYVTLYDFVCEGK